MSDIELRQCLVWKEPSKKTAGPKALHRTDMDGSGGQKPGWWRKRGKVIRGQVRPGVQAGEELGLMLRMTGSL